MQRQRGISKVTAWKREAPGVLRISALASGVGLTALLARHLGMPVAWGTAILYGITLAVAMRWPIVMPVTGARVVLLTGLLMEALWHHGLPTAIILLLVEFAVRMVVLAHGRHYWEWYRPIIVLSTLLVTVGISNLLLGSHLPYPHNRLPDISTVAIATVFAFWALLNASWTFLKAPMRGRTRLQEYVLCMQQTWWAPLLMLAVAWPMEVIHQIPLPVDMVMCLVLLWIQSQVGPVFTTLHQDRTVTDMVRLSGHQSPQQRGEAQRVLKVAYSLARAIPLPLRESRLVGYAALLQDPPEEGVPVPRWLPHAPTQEEVRTLERHVHEAVRRVERDGALQDVADLIRFRYAAYDGRGYPEVAGEAIPAGAQVLAAANAIVIRSGQSGTARDYALAVEWLRTHAAGRFSPVVLGAMVHAFASQDRPMEDERGLPETVRQLQRLVTGPEGPPAWVVALRRVLLSVRTQARLGPDLPEEVQAVARLAHFFASCTTSTEVAQIAVEAVGQLVGARTALALSEGAEGELTLRFKTAYGFLQMNPVGRLLAVTGGAMSRAILGHEPVQVLDLREMRSGLAQELAQVEGLRAVLYVPLVERGRTIGLLMVGMQDYHWFTPREVGLIHLMAGQAASALENARLMDELAERLAEVSNMKAFTDTLLDNLFTHIIVVDPVGRLVLVNAAARWRFGERLELNAGQPLPEELSLAFQVHRALDGESVPECDVVWDTFTLEAQSVPLRDGRGALLGAICIARDVTQVRTMEQQVRRVEQLAAMGELAAGAAHEIRNPLTSIRGFIQLLHARAEKTDGDYFQIILSEIDRIDQIIRDLLLLARPSDLQRVASQLPDLLKEVLVLQRTHLEHQGVSVVTEYDPTVPQVPVDPKMFKQLLLNLVLNAVQAMPFGGRITLVLRWAGPDQVALDVCDTGVGIPPEDLKRLFVPFFTTKEEGTGLGLALCYSIVQAHGGRIDVESRVGQGTTFTITLPLQGAEPI